MSTPQQQQAQNLPPTPPQVGAPAPVEEARLPTPKTMECAVKIAIEEDRPIMMDYWADSLVKKVVIAVQPDTKDKYLVKSDEEYTSPIVEIKRWQQDFIIKTENSIYIVSSDIPVKQIGQTK
jgi:hypothetical protein